MQCVISQFFNKFFYQIEVITIVIFTKTKSCFISGSFYPITTLKQTKKKYFCLKPKNCTRFGCNRSCWLLTNGTEDYNSFEYMVVCQDNNNILTDGFFILIALSRTMSWRYLVRMCCLWLYSTNYHCVSAGSRMTSSIQRRKELL